MEPNKTAFASEKGNISEAENAPGPHGKADSNPSLEKGNGLTAVPVPASFAHLDEKKILRKVCSVAPSILPSSTRGANQPCVSDGHSTDPHARRAVPSLLPGS